MRIFYAESYIIDGPTSRIRLADPAPPASGAVPPAETIFAFQRDLSFGSNTYRYDYSSYKDAVLLQSRNLTGMSYGFVPVIAPDSLATKLLVIQADDAILVYVSSGADAPGFLKAGWRNPSETGLKPFLNGSPLRRLAADWQFRAKRNLTIHRSSRRYRA